MPDLKTWIPHDYQVTAVDFLLKRLLAQLWLTPGLGKTTIALEAFERLRKSGAAKRMLVIAPLRVAQATWPAEVAKWSNFAHLSVGVLHGRKKEKVWIEEPQITVINYEGLEWLERHLRPGMFDVLVFDEISKLKVCTTKRYAVVSQFKNRVPLRWGLTGSPAANHLLNVFGPQLAIDNGAVFGSNYWNFRDAHFYPPRYEGSLQWEMDPKKRYIWAPIPDNVKLCKASAYSWYYERTTEEIPGGKARIYAKMQGKALAMNAIDHLQMPTLHTNDIYISLPSKLEKLYRELEKPWLHNIEDANFAVHGGIAHQFTSGFLYVPDHTDSYFHDFLENNPELKDALYKEKLCKIDKGRQYWHLHNEKIERAQEIVEELQGGGALVAYRFAHELEALKKAFPDAPVLSELNGIQLQKTIDRWNAGEIEVLLCQPKAVGHGLNLQGHGQAVIWFSLTWSLEEYEQTIGRIWRQGQKNNTIVVHRLMIENSIDSDLAFALDYKNQLQLDVVAQTSEHANDSDKQASFSRALEAAKRARISSKQVENARQERLNFARENANHGTDETGSRCTDRGASE